MLSFQDKTSQRGLLHMYEEHGYKQASNLLLYPRFLLGTGNRLFLPSIQLDVTGYCEKNVSEIYY